MCSGRNKQAEWLVADESCQGYSLVELLLAMFVFALVVSSVYGSYKATFAIIQGSEHQATIADRSGFVLSRITEDLESLILGKDGFLFGEEQSFAGRRKDSLSFVSSAQIILGKTDVRRGRILISYLAEVDDRSGLLSLFRAETAILPGVKFGEGVSQKNLLCGGLKELRFTYHDSSGKVITTWKGDGSDIDNGQEAQMLPVMVGVELLFAEGALDKKMQVFRAIVALPQQGTR
jgi:general secretion pathway protein J